MWFNYEKKHDFFTNCLKELLQKNAIPISYTKDESSGLTDEEIKYNYNKW